MASCRVCRHKLPLSECPNRGHLAIGGRRSREKREEHPSSFPPAGGYNFRSEKFGPLVMKPLPLKNRPLLSSQRGSNGPAGGLLALQCVAGNSGGLECSPVSDFPFGPHAVPADGWWFGHSVVSDSATPWAIVWQAPLSMGFPRQECWSPIKPPHEVRWRRQWHPTLLHLPGKSHGQRSLVGCNPWGGCSPWGR